MVGVLSSSRVCTLPRLLSPIQTLKHIEHVTHSDHSGGGATLVGGRVQCSLRRRTLNFEDEEFTAVEGEPRESEPKKQSSDPPLEFNGTKPNEFKSCREKVKLWLLFTRTPAQLLGPGVLSRLTGPAWDACGGLEPTDEATDNGMNVILETLADAFQGEHETELFDALEDTFYGPRMKKGEHAVYVWQAKEGRDATQKQEGNADVETVLAALNEDNNTDLEETHVQETLPAYRESRQRVNRGYRLVTRRTSGGNPYRVEGRLNIKELISCTLSHLSRERTLGTRMPEQRKTSAKRWRRGKKTFFVNLFGVGQGVN